MAKITRTSRYIHTKTYTDDLVQPGRFRMGVWKAPDIDMTNYDRYAIKESDIGRIDLIAWEFYRDVNLWWAIALVNGIKNPFEDLVIGDTIFIPKLEAVTEALAQREAML